MDAVKGPKETFYDAVLESKVDEIKALCVEHDINMALLFQVEDANGGESYHMVLTTHIGEQRPATPFVLLHELIVEGDIEKWDAEEEADDGMG